MSRLTFTQRLGGIAPGMTHKLDIAPGIAHALAAGSAHALGIA